MRAKLRRGKQKSTVRWNLGGVRFNTKTRELTWYENFKLKER